jgi:hypothetical protein
MPTPDVTKILNMRANGVSAPACAKYFGLSESLVANIYRKAADLEARQAAPPPPPLTQAERLSADTGDILKRVNRRRRYE